ncbi:MAG TPA: hypothetical protein VKT52_00820 [Ktedonobacterales bacterium]|nr:hypothetical protein [Ktedonobacterales bacterium]
MASEEPQAGAPDAPGEPAENTQSPRPRERASQRLRRIASILLVAGAAAQIVTWSLPWEHVGALGNQPALDLDAYTFIFPAPLSEIFNATCLACFSLPQRILLPPDFAAIFWDVLWWGTLLFIGLLLVLALFSAKRPVIRWSFAMLYGLWLAYTTVVALDLVKTVLDIDSGLPALPPSPEWWTPYIQVMVTGGGGPNLAAVSPAWGFWLFVGALVICWLALGLTVYTLLHSQRWRDARAERAKTKRKRQPTLAAILITAGAAVWIASFVALPMVIADCGNPLVQSLTADDVSLLCAIDARVYPLQVSDYSFTLDPLPPPPYSWVDSTRPGNQVLGVLGYFRDFGLLVLAIAATPLALAAAWRAQMTRGPAIWLSVWAMVALAETGYLLHVMTELMSPTAPQSVRPFFAEGIGPAAVLMPLGVALATVGVALYWHRGGTETLAR